MSLLAFCSILGFSIILAHQFSSLKKPAAIITVCSIILVLFSFGMLGILNIGTKILFITGIILFIYSLYKYRLAFTKLPLNIALFAIVGLIWFLLSRHVPVYGWDEFFWAQFTKALKYTNAFYGPMDAVLQSHVRYPPGAPLFQYFFMSFGAFNESALYFANGLIIIAGISTVCDFANRNKLWTLFAFLFSIVLIMMFYGQTHISIVNDPLVGVLFGTGLIISVFYRENLTSLFFILLPLVAVLPLIKETGLVFALTIAGVFVIRVLFAFNLKYLLQTLFILITPLIIRALWNHHLEIVSVITPYANFNLENIKNIFLTPSLKEKTIALKILTEFLTFRNIGLTAIFSCLFLASAYINYHNQRRELFKNILMWLIIIGGLLLYLLVLLLAYIYAFSEYEGLMLASYQRYVDTYLMGFGFLAFMSVVMVTHYKKILVTFSVLLLLVLLLCSHPKKFIPSMLFPAKIATQDNSFMVRTKLAPAIALINKHTLPKDKIWFIYQNSNGLEAMVFRYAIAPRNSNDWNWSLGSKYNTKDVWTVNLSLPLFVQALNGYNYLFLGYADANFWKHYGSVFKGNLTNDKHYVLFKIIRNSAHNLYLQPVNTNAHQ